MSTNLCCLVNAHVTCICGRKYCKEHWIVITDEKKQMCFGDTHLQNRPGSNFFCTVKQQQIRGATLIAPFYLVESED